MFPSGLATSGLANLGRLKEARKSVEKAEKIRREELDFPYWFQLIANNRVSSYKIRYSRNCGFVAKKYFLVFMKRVSRNKLP